MSVEIDQSGKVEQLNTHTVVAFSNGQQGAVYITASTKRIIYLSLSEFLISRAEFNATFFAILIFFAIRDKKLNCLVIDEEYTGKDAVIREKLEDLFKNNDLKVPEIRFGLIGKLSPAHRLSWKIHKKKQNI